MKQKTILLFLLALLVNLQLFSQTGTLTGVVTDAATNEPLLGALVGVEGMPKKKQTDFENSKYVWILQPGTYTITCTYSAYKDFKIEGVQVKAGEITTLNIQMEEVDAKELSTFEVVYKVENFVPYDDAEIRQFQKKNPSSMDIVTIGTLRKMPVTTVSDALTKVSGASIQDNKFAIIRGMNDRYVSAFINGAPLPSSESDRKAISFDIFPSNLLDNIIIQKTGTPDMPGEFAGGIININTRSMPEINEQTLSLGIGYNNLTTGKAFHFYESGSKTDWLGFGNNARKMPDGVPSTAELATATATQRGEYAKLFLYDWSIKTKKALPNLSFQYTLAHADTVLGKAVGSVVALNYYNNNSFSTFTRREYEGTNTEVIDKDSLNDDNYSNTILGSVLGNFSLHLNDNHKIKLNNIFSINSEDRVTVREGAREMDQTEKQWEKASVRWFTQNKMYTGQVIGDHQLNKKIKLGWNIGLSDVQRDIPNMRRMVYQKTSVAKNDGNIPYAAVIDPNNPRAGGIMFFATTKENIYSAKYDLTISLGDKNLFVNDSSRKKANIKAEIKLGGLHQLRDRVFNARSIGFDKMKQGSSIKFDSELLWLEEDVIFTEPYLGLMSDSAAPFNGGFNIKEATKTSDSYTASSFLNAGYLMGDLKFGKKFRATTGLRVESYLQQLNTEEFGEPVTIDTVVMDLLPSLNLVYSFTPKTNLRAAYYRTVSRPEFRELAKFSFYDFITDFVISGNEKLQRSVIDNYDIRFETFPGDGQVFSVSGFYKNISNAIETASKPDEVRSIYYLNIDKVTNIGAELEYRIKLSSLFKGDSAEFLNNTTLMANFSYIKSVVATQDVIGATAEERPLQGQSPILINAGIFTVIPKTDINFNVSYNFVGTRLYLVGNVTEPDYWERPRHLMDVQLTKTFGKKLELKLNIRDIFMQNRILYQDLNANKVYDALDNTMVSNNNARTFSFQVNYKF